MSISVCAHCIHVSSCDRTQYTYWRCSKNPIRQFNAVTGEESWFKEYCTQKNKTGECVDFEEQPDKRYWLTRKGERQCDFDRRMAEINEKLEEWVGVN